MRLKHAIVSGIVLGLLLGGIAIASDIESSNWSETAASNTAAVPNGWPAGMAPSGVYTVSRETMAAVKREWDRSHATLTSAGTDTITLTPTTAIAASYVRGQQFCFVAGGTNTGAATLNVSARGAVAIKKGATGGLALVAGDITTGGIYCVQHDGTNFQMMFQRGVAGLAIANTFSAAQTITLTDTTVPLTLTSTDAGASTFALNLFRNSASPAASDSLGSIEFSGKDDAGNTQDYAYITGKLVDPTSGSEDSRLSFLTTISGTSGTRFYIGDGFYSLNTSDEGPDSINSKTIYASNSLVYDGQTAHLTFHGTSPAVASGAGDCGTSPSIAGNDTTGRVTVGSSTNGGKCTLTFATAYTNAPQCSVSDETTGVLVRPVTTTTTLAITGVIVAGDKLTYFCRDYN